MKLTEKAQKDNYIMKVMNIPSISHVIAHTDKGTLTLKLSKGGSEYDYRFVLDAVPYGDKENKELLELFKGVLFD